MGDRNRFLVAAAIAGLLTATGCGSGDRGGEAESPSLTVHVAASLADVIEEIGAAFEAGHSVEVVVNAAGSGALARQLRAAPRGDLFLSAGRQWIDELAAAGRLVEGSERVVCSNALAVIAHPSATWQIDDPAALAALPFELMAIGDPEFVPAGAYARAWLESVDVAGGGTVWEAVRGRISPAPDVRAALAQVEGSRDVVGIVYRTDLAANAGRVRLLHAVPPERGPRIEYVAAVLAASKAPERARAFLDFLGSESAAEILERHGFILAGP